MLKSIQKALIGSAIIMSASFAGADQMRDALFADAEDTFRTANSAKANILAPQSYTKAADAYRNASSRLEKGQSIEKIKKDLEETIKNLRVAIDATRLAEVTLIRGIGARSDAMKAQAKEYSLQKWQAAETAFTDAASKLEAGNVKTAQKSIVTAEKLYREAELDAIKANYLSNTRNIIAIAKSNNAKKYAPETLAKAELLLTKAEKALTDMILMSQEP